MQVGVWRCPLPWPGRLIHVRAKSANVTLGRRTGNLSLDGVVPAGASTPSDRVAPALRRGGGRRHHGDVRPNNFDGIHVTSSDCPTSTSHASLRDASLTESTFARSRLVHADSRRADLRGNDRSASSLVATHLCSADLWSWGRAVTADPRNARCDRPAVSPGGFEPAAAGTESTWGSDP